MPSEAIGGPTANSNRRDETLKLLGERIASLGDLIEETDLDRANDAEQVEHLIRQARTAAVALNGSALVALIALAERNAVSEDILRWAVGLSGIGLIAGLLAWVFRLIYFFVKGTLADGLPHIRDRLVMIHDSYAESASEEPGPRLITLAAIRKQVRRISVATIAGTILGYYAHTSRRGEPLALGVSLLLFIAAVSIPAAQFALGY